MHSSDIYELQTKYFGSPTSWLLTVTCRNVGNPLLSLTVTCRNVAMYVGTVKILTVLVLLLEKAQLASTVATASYCQLLLATASQLLLASYCQPATASQLASWGEHKNQGSYNGVLLIPSNREFDSSQYSLTLSTFHAPWQKYSSKVRIIYTHKIT